MTLGEFLTQKMLERGETKTEFSSSMNLHPTQLARILNNTTDKLPTDNVLERLSDGLKIPKEELIRIHAESKRINKDNNRSIPNMLLEAFPHNLVDVSIKINEKNPKQEILTILKISEIICSNDQALYEPDEDFAGEPSQWSEIMDIYPQSSKLFYTIEDSNTINIVGDCSFVFLDGSNLDIFFENGVFKDKNIKLEYIAPMTIPGEYDAYILNMSLLNKYNTSENIPQMIASFLARIESYAKTGIYINRIYVHVYKRDIGLYKSLGFVKAPFKSIESKDGKETPTLYELKSFPNDFLYNGEKTRIGKIKDLYEKRTNNG